MSDSTNWSPSYTAWKLMTTILDGRGIQTKDLSKDQLLDLFSDCVNSVEGDYVAEIIDLDDDIEDEDFDEDDIDDDDDED